jgi:transposase
MAYRELIMIEVREILRRVALGEGARPIAAAVGIDRKTVTRYVNAAEEAGVTHDTELTDDVVHDVARRVQCRAPAEPSDEWRRVAVHRERIAAWLTQSRPLRLRKIHTLLTRDHGFSVSYDTLRRFAMQELGWRKQRPTVLVADGKPGEEAQIDFGLMGTIFDASEGRARRFYALVVTLVVSRYMFVWPTFVQTTEAVCEGLDAAWKFFGAMARVLVPDNMSSVVAKADPLAPTITPAFLDYAQTRDIFIDAARVRTPRDKGRVENQIAYVRESCFDGESFTSIDDARRHAARWSRDDAGGRVHGTTRRVPREVFECEERPHMLAAPTTPFDVPTWGVARVHPDPHVQVARALYSVPTRYIGQQVRVRADRTMVRIYVGTELIKTHPRVVQGKRATDRADYPDGAADLAMRSVDGLRTKARKHGDHIGRYMERLLDGPLPWTRMRQAYALLRLCDTYGDGRVEALCQSSLAFDVVDVTRLGRMLKQGAAPGTPEERGGKVVPLTTPRFARSTEHFGTRAVTPRKEGV